MINNDTKSTFYINQYYQKTKGKQKTFKKMQETEKKIN